MPLTAENIYDIAQTNELTKANYTNKWLNNAAISGDGKADKYILSNEKLMCILDHEPNLIHDFINDWDEMKTKISDLYSKLPEDKKVKRKEQPIAAEKPKPKYECTKCGKICQHKYNLDVHMLNCNKQANIVTLFNCKHCNATFNNSYRHETHELACERKQAKKTAVFTCEYCNDTFNNSYRHDTHVIACKKKHDKQQQKANEKTTCDHCSKVFDNSYNCSTHMKSGKCKPVVADTSSVEEVTNTVEEPAISKLDIDLLFPPIQRTRRYKQVEAC
jgi:hypothetical protein